MALTTRQLLVENVKYKCMGYILLTAPMMAVPVQRSSQLINVKTLLAWKAEWTPIKWQIFSFF